MPIHLLIKILFHSKLYLPPKVVPWTLQWQLWLRPLRTVPRPRRASNLGTGLEGCWRSEPWPPAQSFGRAKWAFEACSAARKEKMVLALSKLLP